MNIVKIAIISISTITVAGLVYYLASRKKGTTIGGAGVVDNTTPATTTLTKPSVIGGLASPIGNTTVVIPAPVYNSNKELYTAAAKAEKDAVNDPSYLAQVGEVKGIKVRRLAQEYVSKANNQEWVDSTVAKAVRNSVTVQRQIALDIEWLATQELNKL